MARKIRVSKSKAVFFPAPCRVRQGAGCRDFGAQTILGISGYEANKEIFMKLRRVQQTRLRADFHCVIASKKEQYTNDSAVTIMEQENVNGLYTKLFVNR
jgi:hypothetical protein